MKKALLILVLVCFSAVNAQNVIHTYPVQTTISTSDKLLGTDISTLQTKNFRIEDIVDVIAANLTNVAITVKDVSKLDATNMSVAINILPNFGVNYNEIVLFNTTITDITGKTEIYIFKLGNGNYGIGGTPVTELDIFLLSGSTIESLVTLESDYVNVGVISGQSQADFNAAINAIWNAQIYDNNVETYYNLPNVGVTPGETQAAANAAFDSAIGTLQSGSVTLTTQQTITGDKVFEQQINPLTIDATTTSGDGLKVSSGFPPFITFEHGAETGFLKGERDGGDIVQPYWNNDLILTEPDAVESRIISESDYINIETTTGQTQAEINDSIDSKIGVLGEKYYHCLYNVHYSNGAAGKYGDIPPGITVVGSKTGTGQYLLDFTYDGSSPYYYRMVSYVYTGASPNYVLTVSAVNPYFNQDVYINVRDFDGNLVDITDALMLGFTFMKVP